MELISVLEKELNITYVSEASIIRFISINGKMNWEKCFYFVKDKHIVGSAGRIMWDKHCFDGKNKQYYNKHQIKWITLFFDAHPWIERMMVIFDD